MLLMSGIALQKESVAEHIHEKHHQNIGFEEGNNGIYNAYYCSYLIGRFCEEILQILDIVERVPTRARHTQNL